MATTNRYYKSEYIDGNTVRQTSPARERREYTNRQNKQQPGKASQLRANEKARAMNAPYVVMLAAVTLICMVMCVAYLHLQAQVSGTRVHIAQLKTDINTLQSQNDALHYSINSNIDAEHIYKAATTRLGMKQASDNQISKYKSSDIGYTVQYGDIPLK